MASALAGVLATLAAVVLGCSAGSGRRRLAVLACSVREVAQNAAAAASPRQRLLPARVAAAAAGCGVAAVGWDALGPVLGALAGLATAIGAVRVLGSVFDGAGPRKHHDAGVLRRELPAALDLLAACLASGAAPVVALSTVAHVCAAPLGSHLTALASALADPLAVGNDEVPAALRPVARIMHRAHSGGAPAAEALVRLAGELRAAAITDIRTGIARLGVRAVLPLGLCFLPAFVLVGVLPIAVGLVRSMW